MANNVKDRYFFGDTHGGIGLWQRRRNLRHVDRVTGQREANLLWSALRLARKRNTAYSSV